MLVSARALAALIAVFAFPMAEGFAACNLSTQELADCMPGGSPAAAPTRNSGSRSSVSSPARRGGSGGGGNVSGAVNDISSGIENIMEGARECPALTRANTDSKNIDERHHALWRQYFGDVNYAWKMTREDCTKIRQISAIEIPIRSRSAQLRKAAEVQCGHINWQSSGFPPEKFIADFQEANRQCLPILQASNGKSAQRERGCPGDAMSYVKIIPRSGNDYAVVNTCAERSIQATVKTGDVCALGTTSNQDVPLSVAGRALVVSLCRVRPEVMHATFSSVSAR